MAGATNQVAVSGIILYGWDGAHAYPLLCDTAGVLTTTSSATTAVGTNQMGQINQCEVTGSIVYGWDGSNAYPIKVDSDGAID